MLSGGWNRTFLSGGDLYSLKKEEKVLKTEPHGRDRSGVGLEVIRVLVVGPRMTS